MSDTELAVKVPESRLTARDEALAKIKAEREELVSLKELVAKATATLDAGVQQGKLKNHLGGHHCVVQAATRTLAILKGEEE